MAGDRHLTWICQGLRRLAMPLQELAEDAVSVCTTSPQAITLAAIMSLPVAPTSSAVVYAGIPGFFFHHGLQSMAAFGLGTAALMVLKESQEKSENKVGDGTIHNRVAGALVCSSCVHLVMSLPSTSLGAYVSAHALVAHFLQEAAVCNLFVLALCRLAVRPWNESGQLALRTSSGMICFALADTQKILTSSLLMLTGAMLVTGTARHFESIPQTSGHLQLQRRALECSSAMAVFWMAQPITQILGYVGGFSPVGFLALEDLATNFILSKGLLRRANLLEESMEVFLLQDRQLEDAQHSSQRR